MSECTHVRSKKFGRTKGGEQRYRCLDCGKTFVESTRTLDGMRIGTATAAQVIRCTLEGVGVRGTARLCGVDQHTVMDAIVLIGQRCKEFAERTIVNVPVKDVQADEIWSFVGVKEKTRRKLSLPFRFWGDQYCFVGMERHHKLALAWHLGNRESGEGALFVNKLNRACWKEPFQITTDGWLPYKPLISNHMRQADYGMLIKIYGPSQETTRYSPAQIIEVKRKVCRGNPEEERMCTSHVERGNLNLRMTLKRWTRLTNCFSRKWENHEAALGLYFANYNWVVRHGALRTTPAVAAGLADRPWTVAELIERTATCDPPRAPEPPKNWQEFLDTLPDEG